MHGSVILIKFTTYDFVDSFESSVSLFTFIGLSIKYLPDPLHFGTICTCTLWAVFFCSTNPNFLILL